MKRKTFVKKHILYPKISSMNLKEPSERYVELKNKNIKLILDSKKGNTIKELFLNLILNNFRDIKPYT